METQKRGVGTWLAALSFAAALTSATAAEAVGEKVDLKIGAMRLGTSWYVYGATFAKLLKPHLPPGSEVEVLARGGGVANPIVVSQGKAQVALSNVATAVWAWNGLQDVYEGKTYRNIRALVGGLNNVYIAPMIKEDFIRRTGLDTVEKLLTSGKPFRLVLKPKGSSAIPAAEMILNAYGLSLDKVKEIGGEVLHVSPNQIPSVLRDNRADFWIDTAIAGHPAITEAALTAEIRFVDIPDKAIAPMEKNGLFRKTMPVYFKGQPKPIHAVVLGTVLIANETLPEDVAYTITKVFCENKEALVAAHKSLDPFEPKEAWRPENTGIPLHPGAERYYREAGWMK